MHMCMYMLTSVIVPYYIICTSYEACCHGDESLLCSCAYEDQCKECAPANRTLYISVEGHEAGVN